MEDITLALITLTSFVLLFVVAIFADKAGLQAEERKIVEPVLVPVDDKNTDTRRSSISNPVDYDVA